MTNKRRYLTVFSAEVLALMGFHTRGRHHHAKPPGNGQ
ncbi:hypothetical protein YPPY46_2291 [Yersinia pestis PY-46]|uniref:Transposase n=2 Tax=Yersinia pestis TaxID=632 RepID=A0AB72ZL88_YERPE|nr:hypothetical protein YPIP275_3025 [Yersinia pestis biovar Orientalis str. IP275]EDR44001.1 hypothetical protein YpE1979001_0329 [Yersinia pestis biovar Antiqua str. E1979001]EDR52092.1 hypothetical protein YpB42003004_1352 [Yersinia pestis biovar Antiqua str. B42003004]EDR60935.1 hypothetical protein YpUG050454_3284 [Yersinia pestis biovar Antiqua str. UG05-0454]EIQ88870.1 hypothetical protein YPPY01_2242 [Yersinia pestis PY-01]EIQ98915.1 hypothetical protein YPPY03_0043 [Yersinia pestis PY